MPKETKKIGPGIDLDAGRVSYDYIKSNYFRVVHLDGIYGGPSPRLGIISMSIWNERWPIPKRTVNRLEKDGTLGEEIEAEKVMRDAIVREVEAEIRFDIGTAKVMRDWLNDKIGQIEKIMKKVEKEEKPKRRRKR